MILPLAGLLLGLLIGAFRAKKRGGKTEDILQWAVIHGLILAMIGLFALVFIERIYA